MNSNFNDNLKSSRHGFTLTELLFVIAIIAVLGAMAAGILGKAQKDAKIAATRSRITQIEAIMQTVTENLEVRRLPFRDIQLAAFVPSGRDRRLRIKNLRRRIVAAMVQAEFPGPLFDGENFAPNPEIGQLAPSGEGATPVDSRGLGSFREWAQDIPNLINFLENTAPVAPNGFTPTSDMTYWQNLATNPRLAVRQPTDIDDNDIRLDQPGEFLYLALERINVDGSSALEVLGSNVVGDSDGDGILEIVDAFGDPMQLRIVQVAVTNMTVPATDIWEDVPESQINWKQFTDIGSGVKVPNGYQFLNPVVPRLINKIRFQIVSPNLEEIE